MALSDHDQTILRQMEVALRADTTRSTAARPLASLGAHHYLSAAIGLLIAGALAMTIGLRLADDLGTGLGVFGFLLFVGSIYSAIPLANLLRSKGTARSRQPN